MKKRSFGTGMVSLVLFLVLAGFFPLPARGSVYSASLDGTVGIAMENFVSDVLDRAEKEKGELVIFKLDTPGGLVSAMRGITSAILESPVPVVVWVSPQGARAASAGAFILQAAHVAAMAPGTNAGAAQPVMASGKDAPDADMKRKLTNDLSAQMRSLAQLRKRNAGKAERMVYESLSLTAEEALSEGVVDLLAPDMESLLLALRGRSVNLGEKTLVLDPGGEIVEISMTLREKILQFVSSPDIAYLLLTAGVLAVIFEVISPGGFVLGTAGAVMVLLGAFGLRMLPFNWAGVLLLVAGIGVLILDLLVGGIGVLSLFGLAALVTGGLVLFRAPGGELLNVSVSFIAGVTIALGAFFLLAIFLVLRSLRKKTSSGKEGMIGASVEVLEDLDPTGMVKSHGELWVARSASSLPIRKGARGRIVGLDGIVLIVEAAAERPPLIGEAAIEREESL